MSCRACEGIERQFDRGNAEKELRRFQRNGPISATAYGFTLGGSRRTNCPASMFSSRTVYTVNPDGMITGPTSWPPTIAALTSDRTGTPSLTKDTCSGACICEPSART
jgi:hypothetical protein